ncbi:MAG: fructosamine kinase family protein [Cyclonatronaceae bacterium]
MLSNALISSVEQQTGSAPEYEQRLGGGSINDAAVVRWRGKKMVLKWNSAALYDMFEVEQRGLELLHAHRSVLEVPQVEATGVDEAGDVSWILMPFIPTAGGGKKAQETFGRGLAELHRAGPREGVTEFGLDHNNYIGRLPQDNTPAADWPEFFIERRIRPQLEAAVKAGLMPRSSFSQLDAITLKTPGIFPEEPPALLHGDLWGGNYLYTPHDTAALIDPAVYYGHREMELAFTMMFGRFASGFYEAYEESWPLAPGFAERKDLCNLYPVLVHVNLFGHGYTGQAKSILKRYA